MVFFCDTAETMEFESLVDSSEDGQQSHAMLLCRVSIFVCGREYVGSEDACRISSLKQPATSGGHYEKGVCPQLKSKRLHAASASKSTVSSNPA